MEYKIGDIIEFKKPHPCGSKEWEIIRVGVDFKFKCTGCGHIITIRKTRCYKKNKKENKLGEKHMKKKESIISKIFSWIILILLLFAIYKLFEIYKANYFNGFIKAEYTLGISKFSRDSDVKYSESNSYKIISNSQNNAAFYKEIDVEPNTVYKVTCMAKTEDVVPSAINTDGGANICIVESPEISKTLIGTNNWQKLELLFNSQNRTTVQIGFRLGGNSGTAKGTTWFSDFKLEKGIKTNDSNWKVGCFVLKNLKVDINGETMNFFMSNSDIQDVKSNMQRFKTSCENLSNKKMKLKYDIHEVNEPVTTISYSDEHGYYIDPYDVSRLIEDIVIENEYDYIFVAVRMGNDEKHIPVNDWIGLRKYGFIWNWLFKHKNGKFK